MRMIFKNLGLKILLSFSVFLITVTAASSIFISTVKAQTFIDCTATTDRATIAPGESFNLTITWSDGSGHRFVIPEISQNIRQADSSPFTITLRAPDDYFSGIHVANPTRIGPIFQCTANATSTLPPPSNFCTFTFTPTSLKGGDEVTVTVKNTMANFSYIASIGEIQSDNVRASQDNETLTLTLNAPNTMGTYELNVGGTGPPRTGSQACTQEGQHVSLTVTEDKNAGEFTSGRNPCATPDPNDPTKTIVVECPTAFGNIPTNITEFAGKVLTIAIGIAGGLALILLVYGSIRVLTSSGNQQSLATGRDIIIAAIAGLLFLIFSVLILRALGLAVGIPLP